MINPRRINQMYQAIEHGIPWQEMELEPPLSDEEIEFFEDVKREYDETVAEFGSCSLEPVELNWEDIPDIYHDDGGERRAMAAADEPRMAVGAVGRIDHGKTSLTAAIKSVLSAQEGAHAGIAPEHIYFDMDGVLADFDRGVKELAGFERHHAQGESEEEDDLMWEALRRVDRFYDRLEPIPGSIGLFRELHSLYGDRCEVLTGIPTPRRNMPTSGDDKIAWCRRLLPAGVKVNVVYRRDKPRFCKGRESVLVDDFHENVSAWEALGGTGILFTSADEARKALSALSILRAEA